MEWWSSGVMHLNPMLLYSSTPYVSRVDPVDLQVIKLDHVFAHDFC